MWFSYNGDGTRPIYPSFSFMSHFSVCRKFCLSFFFPQIIKHPYREPDMVTLYLKPKISNSEVKTLHPKP